jgi:hypothetical protein
MYETIINACFVAAKGKEAAERAMRHSMQKSYRDLHRVSEINKQKVVLKWDTTVDISKVPEFKAALEEFTGNKGREITSWTPETVEKRLEEIDKRYGQKVSTGLQFGLIAIYRHASEIAHGTFFGAMFILGLTNPMGPPKDIHSIASSMRGNLCMLLQMTGHCVESLIVVLAEELKLPELAQEARELTIELSKESAEGAV